MMAPPVMPHDVASVEPRVGPLHTIATTVPKTAAESTFALAGVHEDGAPREAHQISRAPR